MSDLKGVKCQVGLLNGQNENRDLAKYFLLIMLVATNFNQSAAQSQFELSLAQLSPTLLLLLLLRILIALLMQIMKRTLTHIIDNFCAKYSTNIEEFF